MSSQNCLQKKKKHHDVQILKKQGKKMEIQRKPFFQKKLCFLLLSMSSFFIPLIQKNKNGNQHLVLCIPYPSFFDCKSKKKRLFLHGKVIRYVNSETQICGGKRRYVCLLVYPDLTLKAYGPLSFL